MAEEQFYNDFSAGEGTDSTFLHGKKENLPTDSTIRENFLKLVKNQSAPLPDATDLEGLMKELMLSANFTRAELEKNSEIAYDVLDDLPENFRIAWVKKYLNKGYENLLKSLKERKEEEAISVEEQAAAAFEPEKQPVEEIETKEGLEDIGKEESETEAKKEIVEDDFNDFIESKLDNLIAEAAETLELGDKRLVELIKKSEPTSEDKDEIEKIESKRVEMGPRISSLKKMRQIRLEISNMNGAIDILERKEALEEEEAAKLKNLKVIKKGLDKLLLEEFNRHKVGDFRIEKKVIVSEEPEEKQVQANQEIKIDTEKWSDNIGSGEYRNLMNIIKRILEEKDFSKKREMFEERIVYNRHYKQSVRSTLNKANLGIDKNGQPVNIEIINLRPEHEVQFDKYLNQLFEIFKMKSETL